MQKLLEDLSLEVIGSGLVGLIMVGVVSRNAILGFIEARSKMKDHEKNIQPFAAAMGLSWDRDQIERALQLLERISEVLELQAKHMEVVGRSQAILSDQFQQSTQSRLSEILGRLEEAEMQQHPRPRPRTRRKAKSSP